MKMNSRDQEWEDLYEKLCAALAEFGKDGAYGDYLIVDDDWGGHHQKICIGDANFWSPQVGKKIRDVIAEGFPHWGVYIVFEYKPKRPGLIVYADGNHIEPQEPRWP